MTRIDKISELQHPGVFLDFTWPSDLLTFARFNLIFGPNASGKTTVSRVFRYLEKSTAPPIHTSVKVCINGKDLEDQDFQQNQVPVRVFNRDFVEESVFPVGGGDVPFIVVLGEESADNTRKVHRLKETLSEKKEALNKATSTRDQAVKDFDNFCSSQALKIKTILRGPSSGQYNNYNRPLYRAAAQSMAGNADRAAHVIDAATQERLLRQFREEIKPSVDKVNYSLPSVSTLCDSVTDILTRTVTSSVINALKDDPELGDWTRTGLQLHRNHRQLSVCLFCEQHIPKSRWNALESHFSDVYDRFIEDVDTLVTKLETITERTWEIDLPHRTKFYDNIEDDYEDAKTALEQVLDSIRKYNADLIQLLKKKREQPFKKLELTVGTPEIDVDVVTKLNQVIQEHNKACDNFQGRRTEVGKRVVNGLIAEGLDEFSRLATAKRKPIATMATLESNINEVSNEIKGLQAEISGHFRPAEELNEELRKYLGYSGFKLEARDNGYQIMRGDVPADSLSEGEKTALALLYFLKSLSDQNFDLNQGVVVLDDPVSSLDSNALYLAFGYIKERTGNAAQLFVLTHNFAFFRLVRRWFHHIKGQKKTDIEKRPSRFYMLERQFEPDSPRTVIRALDPLLEYYESEYHYLFALVFEKAQAEAHIPLNQAYLISNVSRRLLEAFLAFRYPQIPDNLRKKIETVKFEEAKKIRIGRFINTHSHDHIIDEPGHDPAIFCETRSVLNDILDLIKSVDHKHFKAMTELATTRLR